MQTRQPESSGDGDAVGAVLRFWREAGQQELWFAKDAAFDARFRDGFLALHMAVAARAHDEWIQRPDAALALLILTDQLPRNVFRGTAHMYATDPLARHFAREALDRGHRDVIEPGLRVFFCLPFSHSEAMADQDLAVALNRELGQPWLTHAEGHRDIVRRFGRFPHRNRLLGRATTPEEQAFLDEGGFSG